MRTAKEIMTKDVITVSPDATVEELARILMEHRISGVPVVDDTKRMVGIITENDLIRKNTRFHIPTVINIFDNYIVLGSGKADRWARTPGDSVTSRLAGWRNSRRLTLKK